MAISTTLLTSGSSGTDAASYTTASVTPTANRLQLLAVEVARYTAGPPGAWTVTGNGLTWVEVARVGIETNGANYNASLSLFRAMGPAPTAGAITINLNGTTAVSCAWSLVECAGVDTSGTNGSGAIVQAASANVNANTALTVTLGAFSSVNNATFACFGASDAAGTPRTYTAGTGFTEIADTGVQYSSVTSMFRADNDTTANTTTSASTNIAGIAVELKASGNTMTASPGSFAITGNVVGTGAANVMQATKATFVVGANSVNLNNGLTVTLASYGGLPTASGGTVAATRTAFTNALNFLQSNGGGKLIVGPGTYDMGSSSVNGFAYVGSWSNLSNISIEGPGATFLCNTTAVVMPIFFYFTNCSNMRITGLHFMDSGFDPTVNWKGAVCVALDTSVPKSGFYMDCTATGVLTLFRADSNPYYVMSGFDIRGTITNGYYGVNPNYSGGSGATNQCDITCINVRRAFISYGCKKWNIKINGSNTNTSYPGSNGFCSVIPETPTETVEDVNVTINYSGYSIHSKLFHLYNQGNVNDGAQVKRVNATINLSNVSGIDCFPFYIDHEGSGGPIATTNREWSDIVFDGSVVGALPSNWTMISNPTVSTDPQTSFRVKAGIAANVNFAALPSYFVPDTGLAAAVGSVAITGPATGLRKAVTMTAAPAAFNVTGIQANMPESVIDWSSIGEYGTAHERAPSSSLTLFAPALMPLTPGDVVIIAVGSDNIQTVDGPSTLVNSVVGTHTGTFTKAYEYTNARGSAGAGITCSVWWKRITDFIPAGTGEIDISFASNVTAKVATSYVFHTSRARVTLAAAAGQADDAGPAAMSFSGLTSRQYLFFRAVATETGTYSFAPTAGFTVLGTDGTTIPGDINDASIGAEFRILTGTGVTSDPDTVATYASSVLLALTTENSLTMPADSGAMTVTGLPATLPSLWKMVADPAAFSVTGSSTAFYRGQRMVADTSPFEMIFYPNEVVRGKQMSATGVAMTVTPVPASFIGAWRMLANVAAALITGISATIGAGGSMPAAAGTLTVTGQPITFSHIRRMDASWTGFEVLPQPANFSLIQARIMPADRGRFLSFNPDIILRYSAEGPATPAPVLEEQGYRYKPDAPPSNASVVEALAWVLQELERASNVINNLADGKTITLHAPPDKLIDGMIRKADGTDWNPGGLGAGVYCYNGATSTWVKLG